MPNLLKLEDDPSKNSFEALLEVGLTMTQDDEVVDDNEFGHIEVRTDVDVETLENWLAVDRGNHEFGKEIAQHPASIELMPTEESHWDFVARQEALDAAIDAGETEWAQEKAARKANAQLNREIRAELADRVTLPHGCGRVYSPKSRQEIVQEAIALSKRYRCSVRRAAQIIQDRDPHWHEKWAPAQQVTRARHVSQVTRPATHAEFKETQEYADLVKGHERDPKADLESGRRRPRKQSNLQEMARQNNANRG